MGRPRKYATTQAASNARKQRDRDRYLHKRQPQAPPAFIAYEPVLPSSVPTETPADIGLRISPDIPIPRETAEQCGETLREPPRATKDRNCDTPCSYVNGADTELTAYLAQLQVDDQEQDTERDEHEAAILQQIKRAAEAEETELDLGYTQAEADSIQDYAREEEMEEDEEEYVAGAPSCFQATEHTRKGTPLSHSSSRSSRSAASASFPAQKNTLLNWISQHTSLPREHPVVNQGNPQPAVQGEASKATLLSPLLYSHPPTPATIPNASEREPPDEAAARRDGVSEEPLERTAIKLAKQLRRFQGCTHEEHRIADRLHQEHHQRPDVHSACSSLQDVTHLLRGSYDGGTPFPDVLSNPKLLRPADLPTGLDLRGAFEGSSLAASPWDAGTPDENLPKNLCLSQHHGCSPKNRAAQVTFDIDSLCCFPSSLAIARQGINWFPRSHAFLNFSQDIHFSLTVRAYNNRDDLVTRNLPLHTIPHYCFGTVIGMETLFIYMFFPELRLESHYSHTTYLSTQDQELWYDAVLLPALRKTVGSSNMLQHYPVSAHIAKLDATALATESFAQKESAREQLLKYALQPQHLDPLWTYILESIADNPGFSRFSGATLFMHAKNTKLEHMDESLSSAYARWEHCWYKATDPQFYSKDRTYVDLGKQVTSEDSALPYDQIPEQHEAEVYLWKRCCLEAYARTRILLLADGKRTRGSPRCTTYPWAGLRDTMGQTLFAVPQGKESMDGLIYSQFYGLIKTPFDTSKTYVFDNDAIENLALDPGYIRSLQQQGGRVTFSKAVCEFAYLHSKKRAHANLVDNQWKSYGIREEHRISLRMMDEIYEQWREWDLYDDRIDDNTGPLPYYVAPTQALFGFLSAQINKYCLLFEYTLAHTARTFSLPETMVMVVALRALRFCYSSNLIQRESLLYKNRWEKRRGPYAVVKEGLGMEETMERCGLGWFLPKFNWATRRIAPPHGDNMLVGNLLMHAEYKRRWKAVKDLRDVFVRFNQAESWYNQYNVEQNSRLLRKWLEYLHVLNLEQFDNDVWKAMLAAHKRHPELSPHALEQDSNVAYCYRGMKDMFVVDGVISPPHIVTGNKMRFEKMGDLLDFLFLWDDGQERQGWQGKPYRMILQRTFEMVERRLGYNRASRWLDEFLHLVRLTHWILPYPSNNALIASTKTSRRLGLSRRMMWFSAVYAHPDKVELPFQSMPRTLYTLLWRGHRQISDGDSLPQVWSTSHLIQACRTQGVRIHGLEESKEYWIAGRRSAGTKGFHPVWERSQAPSLKMLEQIRNKSLDELEQLMIEITQENSEAGEMVRCGGSKGSANSGEGESAPRSIGDVFTQFTYGNARSSGYRTSASGSVFVPSST